MVQPQPLQVPYQVLVPSYSLINNFTWYEFLKNYFKRQLSRRGRFPLEAFRLVAPVPPTSESLLRPCTPPEQVQKNFVTVLKDVFIDLKVSGTEFTTVKNGIT